MKYVMEEEAVKRTFLMVLPNLLGAILSVVLIQVGIARPTALEYPDDY